jgi:hypothetical protein
MSSNKQWWLPDEPVVTCNQQGHPRPQETLAKLKKVADSQTVASGDDGTLDCDPTKVDAPRTLTHDDVQLELCEIGMRQLDVVQAQCHYEVSPHGRLDGTLLCRASVCSNGRCVRVISMRHKDTLLALQFTDEEVIRNASVGWRRLDDAYMVMHERIGGGGGGGGADGEATIAGWSSADWHNPAQRIQALENEVKRQAEVIASLACKVQHFHAKYVYSETVGDHTITFGADTKVELDEMMDEHNDRAARRRQKLVSKQRAAWAKFAVGDNT